MKLRLVNSIRVEPVKQEINGIQYQEEQRKQ